MKEDVTRYYTLIEIYLEAILLEIRLEVWLAYREGERKNSILTDVLYHFLRYLTASVSEE